MTELIVTGILLDMDGTLVNSNALVEEIWTEFANATGLDAEHILAISHGRPTIETLREILPDTDDAERWRIRNELESQGLVRTDGVVEIPGAADFMQRVLAAGLPHALVTSAPLDLAEIRFEAANVAIPDARITVERVTNGKPHPEPFLLGAELLGMPLTMLAGFEDSAAGLQSVRDSGAYAVVVGEFDGPEAAGLPRITDWRDVEIEPRASGEFALRIPA